MKITDLTKYNMNDYLELYCENYTATEKIQWKNATLGKSTYKYLYRAKLYNPNIKKKNYFMNLFMLADEKKGTFSLVIRGNLNNWYSQNPFGKKLTIEEYKDCMSLLLSEIEIEESQLMNAKVQSIEIRLRVLLHSNFRTRKVIK